MTTPAPPTSFSTRRAGIRQALVDADIVGRAVFNPSGIDQAKTPYIILVDALDTTPMVYGDGQPLGESVVGEARLYQANSRDADPTLAPRMFTALQGLRFTVGTGANTRQVVMRAMSPTTTEAEGLDERIVRWTAYQSPGTP